MKTMPLSRRDFLKIAAVASAGLVVVSCGGTGSNSGSQRVRILVDSWALAGAPFKEMAEKYNALHPEVEIKIEPSPGGWMTKVTGQIRSNELQWSGAGVMTTFNDLAAWVKLGLVQPADEYISASKEAGAATFLSDMLAPVKADASYDGKVYGIPYSIENITYQWRTDLFGQAGVKAAPTTWQELYDYSQELKDYLKAQGNTDTHAFAFDLGGLSRNLGALHGSLSDHPYTDEGLMDWESDEMRAALQFMRKLSVDGLTPPNCGEGVEIYDLWKRGRLAGLYSCSSRGVWAQNTLGFDKVTTSRIPTADGQPHSGTMFWGNCLALLNAAPMAQAAMDFLIYALGPQNADWQKAIIQSGTSPAFASAYTGIIEADPAFEPYRWMADLRQEVERSVPAPKNYFYQIQNEAWNRHRPEYLKDGSTMTEDELIARVLASTREIQSTVLESIATQMP